MKGKAIAVTEYDDVIYELEDGVFAVANEQRVTFEAMWLQYAKYELVGAIIPPDLKKKTDKVLEKARKNEYYQAALDRIQRMKDDGGYEKMMENQKKFLEESKRRNSLLCI